MLDNNKTEVVVNDQIDSDTIYWNIPAEFDQSGFELTEEELELIAGGFVCGGVYLGIILFACLGIGFAAA